MSGEASRCFACFGGTVTVHVGGGAAAEEAAARAQAQLLDAHRRLSRFEPESELTRLNRDPRTTVPVSPLLLELAVAVRQAGFLSGGLVDATQLERIERAGYRESRAGRRAAPIELLLHREPAPALPDPERLWRRVSVDRRAGTITRPPGLAIDSGGIAKGLMADIVGVTLDGHETYAVDCCGDLRIGGVGGHPRTVLVEDPAGGDPVHELSLREGGVATSGITRRSWPTGDGGAGHQLLDPSTGRPAFTGIIQATALAPTAFLAEVHAKQALLAGPALASRCLPHGGVLVHADGTTEVVGEPAPRQVPAAG
ncbi:MAG: FAD:protein transferase [Solirubrobacterales bacterium]|nr:FAD:protein transferase [Solirubrobacterales bacterium]